MVRWFDSRSTSSYARIVWPVAGMFCFDFARTRICCWLRFFASFVIGFFGVRSSVLLCVCSSVLLCIHSSGHPTVPTTLAHTAMARVHNLVAHPHKTLFISSLAPTARARRVHTRTAANDFRRFLAKVLPGHLFLALRTFPSAFLAVPDVHSISLPRGLCFLFQAHSTFALFALVRACCASRELACMAPRDTARCAGHFLLVALYTHPLALYAHIRLMPQSPFNLHR